MLNQEVTARSRENMGRPNPFGNDELLVQLSSCKTILNCFRPTCSLPILFFILVNITKLSLIRALTVSFVYHNLQLGSPGRSKYGGDIIGVRSESWFLLK